MYKNKCCNILSELVSEVNCVYSDINDLCFKHLQRKQQLFLAYDIVK